MAASAAPGPFTACVKWLERRDRRPQRLGGQDEPRRAVRTPEGGVVDVRLLDHVQLAIRPFHPSIVRMSFPSTSEASNKQPLTGLPSTSTVHAPHMPTP
jgi:hypothetical protein